MFAFRPVLNCLSYSAVHFALGLLVFEKKVMFDQKISFVQEIVKEKMSCWKYFPYCVLTAEST